MSKKENKNTYFYTYTLHPVNENIENFKIVGGFGSLLTQIDNIYESIPSEDRRTLGRWSNIMNGINYIGSDDPDVKRRLCFRTMPRGKNYPSEHGDFDEVSFTKTAGRFWTGELGTVGQGENGFCPH